MRSVSSALLALGCCWLAGAQAQEAEGETSPELDFLEYLGAWAEEDDEWLAIEEWQKDEAAAPEKKDPEGSERQENDDDESE